MRVVVSLPGLAGVGGGLGICRRLFFLLLDGAVVLLRGSLFLLPVIIALPYSGGVTMVDVGSRCFRCLFVLRSGLALESPARSSSTRMQASVTCRLSALTARVGHSACSRHPGMYFIYTCTLGLPCHAAKQTTAAAVAKQ